MESLHFCNPAALKGDFKFHMEHEQRERLQLFRELMVFILEMYDFIY